MRLSTDQLFCLRKVTSRAKVNIFLRRSLFFCAGEGAAVVFVSHAGLPQRRQGAFAGKLDQIGGIFQVERRQFPETGHGQFADVCV